MLENNSCPPAHFTNKLENLQTSDAYISKTFDLNGIKFGRVVKMPSSITIQKFGPVQ